MDSSLSEVYQDIILDNNRNPRNKRKMDDPSGSSQGYNPSCGDEVTVFVKLDDKIIKELTFYGEGCAISQASASLMTTLLTGKTIDDANKIIDEVYGALSNDFSDKECFAILEKYGEVCALFGVRKFPMRIKCATLAWHAAKDAITASSTAKS